MPQFHKKAARTLTNDCEASFRQKNISLQKNRRSFRCNRRRFFIQNETSGSDPIVSLYTYNHNKGTRIKRIKTNFYPIKQSETSGSDPIVSVYTFNHNKDTLIRRSATNFCPTKQRGRRRRQCRFSAGGWPLSNRGYRVLEETQATGALGTHGKQPPPSSSPEANPQPPKYRIIVTSFSFKKLPLRGQKACSRRND